MTFEREPMPKPSDLTAGFWDAARRHELVVQRCDECGLYRHYPQHLCPTCRSAAWSWAPVNGRGHIYSFTVTHRAFNAAWAPRLPYAVVMVELDEGVRMVSDLPDDELENVEIGREVEVFFEDLDDITLPRFRLAREQSGGRA
jgi:uncharacterized OB-fold protein